MLPHVVSKIMNRESSVSRRSLSASAAGWNCRWSQMVVAFVFVVASLSSIAVAIGPPTNSLRLFTLYEVDWVDPQTGQFGANLTFFRPLNAAPAPGWGVMMTFKNKNAVVENFMDQNQFSMASDGKGSIMVMSKLEAPAPDITPDLRANDASKGLMRMALYLNSRVTAPASVQDLTPTSFSLMAPNDAANISPLVDQMDFSISAVRQGLPQRPFGPFLGASTTAAEQQAADEVPSPKGTDLLEPTGLLIFSAVLLIAGSTFGIGAIDKMNAAKEFHSQRGKHVDSKNDFM